MARAGRASYRRGRAAPARRRPRLEARAGLLRNEICVGARRAAREDVRGAGQRYTGGPGRPSSTSEILQVAAPDPRSYDDAPPAASLRAELRSMSRLAGPVVLV